MAMPPVRPIAPRDAMAMIVTRLGMAAMGLVDIVLLARHGTGELAAAALVETTMGRALDIGAAGIGALLPLMAAAPPALRYGLWQRASALALGWGVVLLVLALVLGPLLAHAGQGPATVALCSRIALIVMPGALVALLAVAAALWLEVSGHAVAVAGALVIANFVNFGLDLVLIPQAGAIGSAFATLAVRIGLLLAFLIMVVLSSGRATRGAAGPRLLAYAGSAAATAAVMHGFGLVLTMLAARQGPTCLAAYAAGWSLNLPAMIIASGLGDALSARVAQGAQWLGWLLRASIVFLVLAALFAAATGAMAQLVSHDHAVQTLLSASLPLIALVLVCDAVNLLLIGILRGAGHLTAPGVVHILGMAGSVALAATRASLVGIVAMIGIASFARLLLMAGYALAQRGSLYRTSPQP